MLTIAPAPPDLAHAVEVAVCLQRDAAFSVTRFPAMPRAMLTLELVPHPGSGCLVPSGVLFHAIGSQPAEHVATRPFKALGLVLHAAAAAALLGPEVGAAVDRKLPWSDVAGRAEARRLDDDLFAATRDEERLQALMDSVRRSLQRGTDKLHRSRFEALQHLATTVGHHGTQAAPLLGLSQRQLQRRCLALLALHPKRLQRLVRFQGLLRAAVLAPQRPGLEQALEAGFYDQSHLAREARLLAGQPLQQVLAGAHDGGAWWPLMVQRRPLRHHR